MTAKTETLTPAELAKIDSLPIFTELQAATLAAHKRTGLRVGVAIKQGNWFVQVHAFAIGPKGKPVGVASVRELAVFQDRADVQAFIEAM